MFLESVYYYDFWRSCDTEDWSNEAENAALIKRINYFSEYIQTETVFTVFVIR